MLFDAAPSAENIGLQQSIGNLHTLLLLAGAFAAEGPGTSTAALASAARASAGSARFAGALLSTCLTGPSWSLPEDLKVPKRSH